MKKILYFALAATLLCWIGTPAQAKEALNDAQIAAIVVAANQVDVDTGEYVADQSKNAQVKAFANQMVSDHNSVNQSATDLVTKLKVTPEASPTSKALKEEGAKTLARLRMLKGEALDKAYLDHEVAYHEKVVKTLDDALIPSAKNEELKAMLIKVRPAFVAHLNHAKQLQETYKKTEARR